MLLAAHATLRKQAHVFEWWVTDGTNLGFTLEGTLTMKLFLQPVLFDTQCLFYPKEILVIQHLQTWYKTLKVPNVSKFRKFTETVFLYVISEIAFRYTT